MRYSGARSHVEADVRSLRPVIDKTTENKENIPEDDKLVGAKAGRKDQTPVNTPSRRNRGTPRGTSTPRRTRPAEVPQYAEHEVQTEGETSLSKYANHEHAYKELAKAHSQLAMQCEKYKKAHATLVQKLSHDKRTWKAWMQTFEDVRKKVNAELAYWKERRQDTPRRAEAISRLAEISKDLKTPPRLSPRKPNEPLEIDATPIRKGGLFSNLKRPVPVQSSNFTGELGKEIPEWRPRSTASPAADPIPSDPPSAEIPETPERTRATEPPKTPVRDEDPENTPTSDAETDQETTPKGKWIEPEEPKLPSPQPGSNKRKRQEQEGTPVKPVVVKSEPLSSESDHLGYHIFEEDSIDLDAVARKPLPALKHRSSKLRDSEPLPAERPTLQGVRLSSDPLADTTAQAHSTAANKDHHGVTKTPTSKRRKSDEHGPALSPVSSNRRAPARSTKKAPAKPTTTTTNSTKKKRPHRSFDEVTRTVLEDGTADGDTRVDLSKGLPDIETKTRLSDLLSTPGTKDPSLRKLAPEAPRTVQPKHARPPSRGDPQPPAAEPRQDPPTASTNPADALQTSRKTLGPEDFRINPLHNSGLDFAFHSTVRGSARKCLPGCSKPCCRSLGKFVEAAGLPLPPKTPKWRVVEGEEEMEEDGLGHKRFIERYGKHRGQWERRRTPPGFWDSEMPDEEVVRERNEEAERRRGEKAEEMRREAERGGRWIYRE